MSKSVTKARITLIQLERNRIFQGFPSCGPGPGAPLSRMWTSSGETRPEGGAGSVVCECSLFGPTHRPSCRPSTGASRRRVPL